MELRRLYDILERLRADTETGVGNEVILEPAGESDADKEGHLRRHHYKVPGGHPQVFAWGWVMSRGPNNVKPKGPCAKVSVRNKLLDQDDPRIRRLELDTKGDFGSGPGERYRCIYKDGDEVYHDVLYALIMEGKACLYHNKEDGKPRRLIVSDPTVMMGKPIVVGTRITVELILEKLAAGETVEQILEAHPRLTREAIQAALAFAAEALRADVVYPLAQAVA